MAPPIGVAMVGCGVFARKSHVPAILQTPELSLKAVYSRTIKSATDLQGQIPHVVSCSSEDAEHAGKGYHNLLQDPNIDAVVIALPIVNQLEFVRIALLAGKHVLSEKPIAADAKTAAETISWYHSLKETGEIPKEVTWSIAENHRFLKARIFAAEETRKLGAVKTFLAHSQFKVNQDSEYAKTAWRKTPKHQGGWILDGGIHTVAGLRYMLGQANEIASVAAFTAQILPSNQTVDTVNATLKTKTGATGVFSLSFGVTHAPTYTTVVCEHGSVTARTREKEVIVTRDGKDSLTEFSDDSLGVVMEHQVWARGILSGVQDAGLTPEEGLTDLRLLEAMLASGKYEGMPIDL